CSTCACLSRKPRSEGCTALPWRGGTHSQYAVGYMRVQGRVLNTHRTRLCGTPSFFPLSSAGLACLSVIVIAGYARGEAVIRGTLPSHRRIALPSCEHTHQPHKA